MGQCFLFEGFFQVERSALSADIGEKRKTEVFRTPVFLFKLKNLPTVETIPAVFNFQTVVDHVVVRVLGACRTGVVG